MGDRFRSMIESEFAEVDAPPIGDLVDNAMRDGRQLRRTRLVQRTVACAAAVGVLALGLGMATATLRPDEAPAGGYAASRPLPPGDGDAPTRAAEPAGDPPTRTAEPAGVRAPATVPPDAPTMAIFDSPSPSGAASKIPPVAPEAALLALQMVLPAGLTVALAGSRFDTYTGVQVFLDRGAGFGMVRVAVARYGAQPKCDTSPDSVQVSCAEEAGALIETFEIETNCVQRRGVTVYRPDGIAVQVNVGSCVPEGPWDAPETDAVDDMVLDTSEAVQIGQDPVWSEGSLDSLQQKAFETYPSIPMLTMFNGVGT